MPTDSPENEIDKKEPEKQHDIDESLDVELNKIEAESEEITGHSVPFHEPLAEPVMAEPKRSFKQRLKAMLRSKKFWALTIISLIVVSAGLWFVQPVRLWKVNLLGLRTSLAITVTTPAEGKQEASKLKNVTVSVNGQEYKTDQEGTVTIPNYPYGKTTIVASKRGYNTAQHEVTLDFDPFFHLFGGKEADEVARRVNLSLKSVGVPVAFKAMDWLSGTPITEGEYIVGDLKVKPDESGVVAFKAPPEESGKVNVDSNLGGKFIDKTFELSLNTQASPTITFVPAGKHYFLSKRDGALGIYSSNLDGSEIQQLIAGTGQETASTAFAVAPDGTHGVLASTRDGARDDQNVLLQRLYVIDLQKRQLTQVDEATYFSFADWSGNTLVYQKANQQLRKVDISQATAADIASGNGFSRKIVSFDQVVFVDYTSQDGQTTYNIRRADLKTGNIKDLGSDIQPFNVVQTDFDRVSFQTANDQKWHEYNFNTGQLRDVAQPTEANTQTFLGTANTEGTKRILVDRIDGKYTIIVKTTLDGAEKQLYGAGGLGGPMRWIGDVIVFRIVTDQETADYAISVKGGEPKKIADITATVSIEGSAVDYDQFRYY